MGTRWIVYVCWILLEDRKARIELLRSLNLPTSAKEDHFKIRELNPPWKQQLRDKTKTMLIEEELRRRRWGKILQGMKLSLIVCVDRAAKLAMANEGREAQQKDEEANTRKRKAEDEKVWEGMDTCLSMEKFIRC